MNIMRPEQDDISAALQLVRALGLTALGYHPDKLDRYGEPAWLDDADKPGVLDELCRLYQDCNLEWLLAALSVLISPGRGIIDEGSDILQIHPRWEQAVQDGRRLDWLIRAGSVAFTDKETDDDGEPLPEKRCVLNETYWISGYEPAGEGGTEREAIDDAMRRDQG